MYDSDGISLRSEVVDISSTDHVFVSANICALHNTTAAAGTVVARLAGDGTTNSTWRLAAGTVVYGAFVRVVRSGTSLTTAEAILGLSPNATDG